VREEDFVSVVNHSLGYWVILMKYHWI